MVLHFLKIQQDIPWQVSRPYLSGTQKFLDAEATNMLSVIFSHLNGHYFQVKG